MIVVGHYHFTPCHRYNAWHALRSISNRSVVH